MAATALWVELPVDAVAVPALFEDALLVALGVVLLVVPIDVDPAADGPDAEVPAVAVADEVTAAVLVPVP